jgi:hypothetical protein
LAPDNHHDTSPLDNRYNCIAHAASAQNRWWWPDKDGFGYWPSGVPRNVTIDAFILSYGTLGYEVCDDASVEDGYEKIALYALNNTPTHAARLLSNGKWTSKLGKLEDIEHDTASTIEGPAYGTAVLFMRRKIEHSSG